MLLYVMIFIVPLILMFIFSLLKQINQYEEGVLFRMGKVVATKGPGLSIIVPIMERLEKVDTRTITHDVPGQDIITKDNVSVRVSAVVYFRVVDSIKALIEVENYKMATSQLAQTTLRSV